MERVSEKERGRGEDIVQLGHTFQKFAANASFLILPCPSGRSSILKLTCWVCGVCKSQSLSLSPARSFPLSLSHTLTLTSHTQPLSHSLSLLENPSTWERERALAHQIGEPLIKSVRKKVRHVSNAAEVEFDSRKGTRGNAVEIWSRYV